ncbi:MAG: hypothetical protein V4628_09490 [Pseudomonadota bacterium]
MKKSKLTIEMAALALASSFSWSLATAADDIGGGPLADFGANELTVPCVEVNNLSGSNANNKFYDVVLDRRGNSMNFELTYAAPEDPDYCQRLVDYANYEDDDYEPNPGENGFGILVRCELEADRSKVSVNAKDLPPGTYYATVTSGLNEELSLPLLTADDEVEFDFDSDEDEVDDGATEIDDDFIQDDLEVTAEIVNDANDQVVYSATGVCLVD